VPNATPTIPAMLKDHDWTTDGDGHWYAPGHDPTDGPKYQRAWQAWQTIRYPNGRPPEPPAVGTWWRRVIGDRIAKVHDVRRIPGGRLIDFTYDNGGSYGTLTPEAFNRIYGPWVPRPREFVEYNGQPWAVHKVGSTAAHVGHGDKVNAVLFENLKPWTGTPPTEEPEPPAIGSQWSYEGAGSNVVVYSVDKGRVHHIGAVTHELDSETLADFYNDYEPAFMWLNDTEGQ